MIQFGINETRKEQHHTGARGAAAHAHINIHAGICDVAGRLRTARRKIDAAISCALTSLALLLRRAALALGGLTVWMP